MKNLSDVRNLFIEDNISSDTSLIFVQGGFRISLVNDKSLDLAKLDLGSYYYVEFVRWFEKRVCKKINFVAVKQFQHLRPDGCFTCSNKEEAIENLKTNIDTIKKVIDHQVESGKKVVLMGHSFGSMLVQEYIEKNGTDKIKKAIICNVRPYNPVFSWAVMQHRRSRLVYGINGEVKKIQPKAYSRKAILMMVPLLKKDYTKLWKEKDLSKIQYIVADGDTYIGNMSKFEEKFIQERGGDVIRFGVWRSKLLSLLSFGKVNPGNIAHQIVFTPMAFPYMKKLVNKGAIVSKFSEKDKNK